MILRVALPYFARVVHSSVSHSHPALQELSAQILRQRRKPCLPYLGSHPDLEVTNLISPPSKRLYFVELPSNPALIGRRDPRRMAQTTETASLNSNIGKRRLKRPSAAAQWAQTGLTLVCRKTLALFVSIPPLILWLIRRIDSFCGRVEVEQPKVVIHTFIPLESLWRAFRKCSIHFASVALTTMLTGLNLGTLFIGEEFQGLNQGYWQDFDKLALQIAAKLYVSVNPGVC